MKANDLNNMSDSEGLVRPELAFRSLALTAIGSLLPAVSAGYSQAVISPVLLYLDVSMQAKGLAVGLFAIGAMVSSLLTALVLADFVLIVSSVVTVGTEGAVGIVTGRAIAGLSLGFYVVLVSVYCAEIAPARFRGTWLSAISLVWLLSEALALGLSMLIAPCWKLMIIAAVLPALGHIVAFMCGLPESPSWLLVHRRDREAIESLRRLYTAQSASLLIPEIARLQHDLQVDRDPQGGEVWRELVYDYRKRFLYVCGFLILFQASGIAGVMYYSSQIASFAGFSPSDSSLSAMFLFLVGAAACLVNMRVIDNYGRRKVLLALIPMQCLSVLGMAVGMYLKVYTEGGETVSKWICLTALLSYLWFLNLGTGPLTGVIPPELFPQRLRSTGCAAGYFMGWVTAAGVGYTFVWVVSGDVGKVAIWVGFGAVNGLLWVITYVWLQETKGRSLEDS